MMMIKMMTRMTIRAANTKVRDISSKYNTETKYVVKYKRELKGLQFALCQPFAS